MCRSCARTLAKSPTFGAHRLPGLDFAWAAFEHTGMARELIAHAKYRGRPGLLDLAIEEMIHRIPLRLLKGSSLVPAPADPWRSRRRGFDAADLIAERLATLTDFRVLAGLRRAPGAPQAGRDRASRLGTRPRIRAAGRLPAAIVLIDDVVTTGATLAACAAAAREAGAVRVGALTLTRRNHGL